MFHKINKNYGHYIIMPDGAKPDTKKEDKKDDTKEDKKDEQDVKPGTADGAAADAAAADGAASAENKTSGTRHCFQRGPVECINNIKDSVKDLPHEVMQKVKGVVHEVKECGRGLPKVFEDMAEGVHKTATNMQKGVTDFADTLANVRVGNVINGNAFYKAYLLTVNGIQQKIDRFLLGDMAGKDVDTTQLLEHVRKTSEKFMKIAQHPKFQKVLREMSDNYGKGIVKSMNAAQPGLDRVTDKAQDMLLNTGKKLGTSVGNTAMNVLKSVIAEIPFIGGVIDAVISVGDLTNKILATCAPPAKFISDVGPPIINGAMDTAEDIKCKLLEIQKKTAGLMQQVEKDIDTAPKQKGGNGSSIRNRNRKSIKRNIDRTTRRLGRLFHMSLSLPTRRNAYRKHTRHRQ